MKTKLLTLCAAMMLCCVNVHAQTLDPLHVEGRDGNTWSVLDYSHIMVHVFTRETRDFYNLDKLYGDL